MPAPARLKAAQLLVNSMLPEEERDYSRSLDAKDIGRVLERVATLHPEKYAEASQSLLSSGLREAWLRGSTLTLDDLRPDENRKGALQQMDREVAEAKRTAATPEEFEAMRDKIWISHAEALNGPLLAGGRPGLAGSVASGARGSPAQMRAMVSTPGVYTDYAGRVIPHFVRHSFSEGLQPAEFLAGTFGARRSVISTKVSTARGGDLGKQASSAVASLLVTGKDCGTSNGIDLPSDDPSLRGRVLAKAVDGIPAGTVIDRPVASKLAHHKGPVIVRSPLTCTAEAGVCSLCSGAKTNGHLPRIGEHVGAASAQAMCLAGGTMIRMLDGSAKPIEDIKPGDIIFGSDESGKMRPVSVKSLWCNGVKKCVRTRYRVLNDQEIEVVSTPEHRLLFNKLKGSWKLADGATTRSGLCEPEMLAVQEARDISYQIYASIPTTYDDTGHAWVPEARLIGILLGDGCISGGTGSGGLSLSAYDPSMLLDLKDDLDYMGINLMHMCEGEYRLSMKAGASAEYQSTSNGDRVRNCLKRILINEGLWGSKAATKKLPTSISKWDNESVFALIAGLIATDGCVTDYGSRHVNFSSNSKQMLEEVRHLLQTRAGIRCGGVMPHRKKLSTGEGFYDPTFKLHVTGLAALRRLQATVGPHIPGVKRDRLLSAISSLEKGSGKFRYLQARMIAMEDAGEHETFDIEVDHPDHIYMLDNMLLTHNSEPVTQAALSDKHTGGQASGKKTYSGMDVIENIIQSPEVFPDKAPLAEIAGRISYIRPAPQGGTDMMIGDIPHYVPAGQMPLVKQGEMVEKGDQLADGIVDAGDVVRLQGLGAGRRHYATRLKQALDDSGVPASLRNTEMLARAAIDHVVLDGAENYGEHLPGDTISYNKLASRYTPPAEAKRRPLHEIEGHYLQEPALHYTIGTQVTPAMIGRLGKAGYESVATTSDAPPFHPEMVRLRTASHNNPDWLARMSTSYLKTNLADSAARGLDTDTESNVHYVPRLAVGENFGENTGTTGKF